MGHKIILCVNERGILLTFLRSGGRGAAVAGAGPRSPAAAAAPRGQSVLGRLHYHAGPCNRRPCWAFGEPRPRWGAGPGVVLMWNAFVSLTTSTFMLLASAGVSGTGALSSADEFVEKSTGDSGPGIEPGASNGECRLGHQCRGVLACMRQGVAARDLQLLR